jgi:hypothetical protein
MATDARPMRGTGKGLPGSCVGHRAQGSPRSQFVLWLSAVSLLGLHRPLPPDRKAEEDAAAAASSWLALVDQGGQRQSWEQAAAVFQGAVSQDQWHTAVSSVRAPLGGCLSRRWVSSELVESMPAAPKATYVVLKAAACFEHRPGVTETIAVTPGQDRRWRVAGYFVG